MSSRKSSSGEGSSSSRCGERTPLRSLQNENLHLSTPSSRLKSKPLTDVVKLTKGDGPLCDPEPHLQSSPSTKGIHINAPTTDLSTTESACGLGDVTFKSFICPGGEVELASSFVCAEDSIVLPKDQAMTTIHETEDTILSDSIAVQSCSDHIEHAYYNPEVIDASLVDNEASCPCEISNTNLTSGDLDDGCATQDVRAFQGDCCGKNGVTWKSFVCDGGEVEVADVTRLQDATIPLPNDQPGEPLQDDGVNSPDLSKCGELCPVDHADHFYFSRENCIPVSTTFFEITNGPEQPADGQNDVTFKSFNCTGGMVEICDGTKLADETIPLPVNQTATGSESYNYGMNPNMVTYEEDAKNSSDHLDHPYYDIENNSFRGPLPFSLDDVDEVKQVSLVVPDGQTGSQEAISLSSFINARSDGEISDITELSQKPSPLTDDQAVIGQPLDDISEPPAMTQDQLQDELPYSHVENDEVVVNADLLAISSSSLTNASLELKETSKKDSMHSEDSALPSMLHKNQSSDCSHPEASAERPTPVEEHVEHVSHVQISSKLNGCSEEKDSALGSSGTEPEKPQLKNIPEIFRVRSEFESGTLPFQFGLLSPVVKRASLAVFKAFKVPALDQLFAEDPALEGEKSLVAPFNVDPALFWTEQMESPMPCPLFNSTVLGCKPQPKPVPEPVKEMDAKPSAVPQSEVEKPAVEFPLIPDGPLQQQLRQMAEFLFLASKKMCPAAVSAFSTPADAVTVPSAKATPAESHGVCVGTTPVKWLDHSVNTSGQFERKRIFTVADSCTLTDPILWNLPPGSLEGLSRQELEQRLRSSMIMVEALVQQLDAARANGCSSAGPPPSDLREKQVQTDHTELSQTTMLRDLYLEALNRIGELELDRSSLQDLTQCMQDMRVTMTSLSSDTDAALSNMKKMGDVVRDDHQSLVSHYGQMRSLFEKTKTTQTKMMQKVKDALHQRDDMRAQMEEAFTAKEAAFSVMEQLRTHCSSEISELERVVGSQQELSAALAQTYPEQVALNKAYNEMLNSASDVLSTTMEEHSSLMQELSTVRGLLQKSVPMLLMLNEKAAAALIERDEHFSAREQAVEEREQIEDELNKANMILQTAREQIGDLNLQVTILTSEMGVLRQKLTEREDERGLLERQVTELSATVSSTLASYTFLEQALASQSTKLQQSWRDIQQAKDRANGLEASLGQSEQRVCELSQALTQSEEQLSQLQVLSQSQSVQIQQLQDVCTQLSGVREMNEFLQMENELTREQMDESERLLSANLQALRQRNIKCEDLNGELSQLQFEKRSLHEELETTKSRAGATQLELRQKLADAVTEITLLHHTLRGLTNELHTALNDQKPQKDKKSQQVERRHPSSSFVDSVMIALTTETLPGSDMADPPCETLFSETSAFTRITPRKKSNAAEFDPEEVQSSVVELLVDLGSTVTELISNTKLLQQRKDAQLEELHHTISGLQVEQQAASNRHEAEASALKLQLSRLNSLFERGNQALQQKALDEKTVTKLMSEVQDTREILNKHKTESNELRKEVVELRHSLKQSQVEAQYLRLELRKAGSQSANPAQLMEEKIKLLKEVETLKLSLQKLEQGRVKLLERAKRHQLIHQANQQKSENELQMLNKMINKVRETLLSLPVVVKNCEQLQQLVSYIG
ncbi:sperm-associated antigen 5 [Trematomus bernacchii]|uniref:sperm-associated antigen 5 n=1 Tax=Trematomus bernacchii TaxID=40690 RepID=UPI00146D2C3C|nr:sperm-associated antigen 5 [Trematomus bernacchii]